MVIRIIPTCASGSMGSGEFYILSSFTPPRLASSNSSSSIIDGND